MLDVITRKCSAGAYLSIFAVTAILTIVVFPIGRMTFESFGCRTQQYGTDEFLAYCRSIAYADYEHGALYYGLEPNLHDNIRTAQVLFLGNSMLQAGFSTTAVRHFFRTRAIRFFVMGFGYGEPSAFAQAVLDRARATPKLIVINADPFFRNVMTQTAIDAVEGRAAFLFNLGLKMVFQRIHRTICRVVSCPENEPSIFRSAKDGQWNWIGPYVDERALPIGQETDMRITQAQIESAKIIGEAFLRHVGLRRQCVVLTGIPNSLWNSPEVAEALAAGLHTTLVTTKVDGLATLDGTHMNLQSAELWSAAFVEALTPIIDECLGS
jgi:hypothetical protein